MNEILTREECWLSDQIIKDNIKETEEINIPDKIDYKAMYNKLLDKYLKLSDKYFELKEQINVRACGTDINTMPDYVEIDKIVRLSNG